MIKSILACLIGCLLLSASSLKEPAIEWLTTTDYDFGLLTQNNPAEFNFEFRNTGDVPIHIDNVRTTCGCTKPVYSDAPVLPDSIGVITIGYDAKKIGYFRKRIRVYLSDQRKATMIFIEGEVE